MNNKFEPSQSSKHRVLIFSQRNLSSILPFRCAHFEFEDVITQIDSAELVAPRIDPGKLRHIFAKRVAYHSPLVLNPGIPQMTGDGQYDLFVAMCGDPTDLLRVATFGPWRRMCKKAVCIIDELWITQMARYHKFLHMLEQFDVVMLYYSHSVDPLRKRISSNCMFLPPGVDAIRFCPYPKWPRRVVDVYSVGRRSKITHRTLLRMAADDGLFYLHDSLAANQVLEPFEHRELFANVAKRSRYFIVNPGLIDRRDIRGDQIEIGDRYFEAAAAGAIMLGERPDNAEFKELFGWPDSVMHLPFDSADIDKVVREIDKDPERQNQMRRMNVRQALMRHDWVYRWEEILKAVGLEPMSQVPARKQTLHRLAEAVMQDEMTPNHDTTSAQVEECSVAYRRL